MHWDKGMVNKKVAHKAGQAGPSRRNFLRKTGLMGAVAAAVAGGAELAGLAPASASAARLGARGRSADTACACEVTCNSDPCGCKGAGHAGGNGCCDSGYCCYSCTYHCSRQPFKACFPRSRTHCDSTYNYCA